MASITILAWNCRGLGNPATLTKFKKISRTQKPQLMFLSETKQNTAEMERIRLEVGFSNCFGVDSVGRSGGLAVLWTEDV
ncbi:hypothetical protein SLA2020_325910 [Shorea laevis]